MNKNIDKNTYFIYCAIVVLMIFIIYREFIFGDYLQVYTDIGSDPRVGYWPIYSHFIESVKNFNLSLWNYEYGIGSSIFTTTWFITDPFNIVLLLFSKKYIIVGLFVTSILKILFSGLFFLKFINYFKLSKYTKLLASILYTFNTYMILWGQHYQFATIFFIFTFILWGFEVYIREKKKIYLYLGMIILFINSIYFAYMITIFLLIYVFFRYLWEKPETKWNFWTKLVKIYVISFLLSAPISMPTLHVLLASSRIKTNLLKLSLFGGNNEYLTTILKFFSTSLFDVANYSGWLNIYESVNISSSIIVIIFLPQLFYIIKDKKKKKILVAISLVILVAFFFPMFTFFINKFSSYTYRWSFLVIPVLLLGFAHAFDSILLKMKFSIRILFCTLTIAGFSLWYSVKIIGIENLVEKNLELIIILALIYTIFLFYIRKIPKRYFEVLILLLCCTEMSILSDVLVNQREKLDKKILTEKIGYFDSTNDVIKYINQVDKSFYRMEKNYFSVFANDSLVQDYMGLKGYNSLNSDTYLDFVYSLEKEVWLNGNVILGFPEEPVIQEILGVKYSLIKGEERFFDFKYIKTFDDVKLYENNNPLGLGFIYNKYITEENFEKLNQEEKRKSLLENIVLKKDAKIPQILLEDNKIPKEKVNFNYFNIERALFWNNNGQWEFLTQGTDSLFYLGEFSYESFLNFSLEVYSNEEVTMYIYIKTKNNELNEFDKRVFKLKKGENNISFNLDFQDVEYLRVGLGEKLNNKLIFKKIEISKNNYDEYIERVKKLKEQSLVIEKFNKNNIRGSIKVLEPGYLFLSLPYEMGWEIKVNGEKTKYEKVNLGFIGIPIKNGEYTIEIKYKPPFLKFGILIFVITILVLFFSKKKNLKNIIKAEGSNK